MRAELTVADTAVAVTGSEIFEGFGEEKKAGTVVELRRG